MSETQEKPEFNPYDSDNMPEGGGLTREVVITSAKYVTYPMKYRNGDPVVDKQTKQPSYFSGLRLEGIRVGGEEGKIDKYEYSGGRKSKPSPDGELLLGEDGKPAPVYKTSNLGRALMLLEKGGFDKKTLYPRVSVLVGAKITFAGSDQKDAAGKVKTYTGTDGKVHNSIEWWPESYNGHTAGGPGAAVPADDLAAEAEAAVVAAIAEAGGSIERKDLIRALGTSLKGNPRAIKITTLVARQDFHTGRPWVVDGTTLKLEG